MAKKKKPEEPTEPEAAAQDAALAPITLRSHPAAMASIRRVRARAGLGAFGLVLLLSLHHGVALPGATTRALIAGVAVQLVAWKAAVIVWRQIVLVQVRHVEEAHRERRRQRIEAAQQAAQA
jgi:hypothetical protein